MGQFEKLFKEIIKPKDYKYNPALSNEANAGELRRLALMEHNVKSIYEEVDKVYGEEYATKLATLILNKSFIVTNLENYTNRTRPYLAKRLELGEYIHRKNVNGFASPFRHFNLFLHKVAGVLITQTREYGEIELYDIFICLSLYVEYIKKYYKDTAKTRNAIYAMFKQLLLVIGTEEGFMQPFTLCILDKRAYDRATFAKGSNAVRPGTGNNLYALPDLNDEGTSIKFPQIHVTYGIYMDTIKLFLEYYKSTLMDDGTRYILPKIRIYADGINKLLPEVMEYISYATGVDESVISDVFNKVGLDSENPDLWSTEFNNAINELAKIQKTPRKKEKQYHRVLKMTWTDVLFNVRKLFKEEHINYLKISDRLLAKTLSKITDLEKKVPAIELILGNRIHKDTATTFFKKVASEVTIEYSYLIEGCETLEEYKERLRQAIHDAQAINQTRFQIIERPLSSNYSLNVKVNGVEEDMQSETYSVLKEETEKLKSIYSQPFTYELCIQKFFKDKTKKYYILVK